MRRAIAILAAALVAVPAVAAPGGPAPLTGRWRMVEQTYGRGGQNLASRTAVLHLDIASGPSGPLATTWADDDVAGARPWPAARVGDAFVDVELLAREIDVVAGRLSARYRVGPVEQGGLLLELVEEYAVDQDVLTGTVRVILSRDGEPRGGYVLHRRYERER